MRVATTRSECHRVRRGGRVATPGGAWCGPLHRRAGPSAPTTCDCGPCRGPAPRGSLETQEETSRQGGTGHANRTQPHGPSRRCRSITRPSTLRPRRVTSATTRPPASAHRHARFWPVLRIAFGLTFLWAFFDKLLALGFAPAVPRTARSTGSVTPPGSTAAARPRASSAFGADGPFKEFYNSIAGAAWADWLLHARPARHRRGAHLRYRHAVRRGRRRRCSTC